MGDRLGGPGKDFDDQWNASRREGQEKAARGHGDWALDHKLESLRQSMDASGGDGGNPSRGKHAKPASDNCVIALASLGGFAWAIAETIRHLT